MKIARDQLKSSLFPRDSKAPVEWKTSRHLVDYQDALDFMEHRVAEIAAGRASECVWLLEHPPLYTAGTSAKGEELITPDRFPVIHTGRGGQYTYHGPGQRIVYVMLDLKRREPDVRVFVAALEDWVISTLDAFNVRGERREDRVGVWVRRPEKPAAPGNIAEDKIAAIGIRLRKWVSFHGISINVDPNLEHYSGIVPCGVKQHGITSLVGLGLPLTIDDVDIALKSTFEDIFGPVEH